MKNQNNIIIFLAFLTILLLIPTVCASDSINTENSAALPSSDSLIIIDLQSGDASAIAGTTDSPLSSPDGNDINSTDSKSVLSASNDNNVLSANPDGTFKQLDRLIAGTPAGGTIVLDRNYVNTDGFGAITLYRTITIDGNGYTIDALGKSRIFTTSTNLNDFTLKNITFKNGYHESSWGGAIQLNAQMNRLVIEDCTFINCTSGKNNGGAIVFTRPVSNSNISAVFIENKAPNGLGAMNFGTRAPVDNCIFNLTFINNTARQSAAANFNANVYNSVFYLNLSGNVADKYGGGVYFHENVNNVNITGIFVNNTAGNKGDGSGGALYFSGPVTDVNINGTFIGNKGKSRYAGAIYSDDSINNMNITGYFENNSANFEGGAIYARTSVYYLNINGTFINNHADGIGGGAIDLGDDVYYSTINGTFIDNTGKKGGAIRVYGNTQDTNITGTFTDNSATCGGAIYVTDSNNIGISGTFSDNAAEYGGAIYIPICQVLI